MKQNQLSEREAQAVCDAAIQAKGALEWRYLELGAMLHRIKKERLYESGWGSWETYAMELKLPESTISRLLNVYETFVLRYQFETKLLAATGGWSVLAELLPAVKEDTPKAEVQRLIGIATDQPRTDLRRTLKEFKTGISMTHKHTEKPYYLKVYPCCGLRERVEKV